MHILELPQGIRDELFTGAIAPMQVNALLTGLAKTLVSRDPDGTPNYTTTYSSVTWAISDRLSRKKLVALEYSKPYLPLDGQDNIIKASRVVLDLINTDEAFAIEQAGAILSPTGIENARVNLVLNVNGQLFPLFRGKIFGRPSERRGSSTIEIRDEFWTVAKALVTYEQFNPVQSTSFNGGTLNATPYRVNGSDYYDGITVFEQDARPLTSVINQNQEQVAIYRINVLNGAKLGKYEINFASGGFFQVTYPDNRIYQGSVTSNFASDFIEIPQTSWSVPNASDLSGKKIEFFVYKTVSGHPVDIILNELEKAYTEAYGTAPVQGAALPIDFAQFALVRQLFSSYEVFVSETNKENSVWLNIAGKRPLNVLQFCQKIADHIGCQIVIDNYGFISIKAPAQLGDTIYSLTDQDAIIACEVIASASNNFFKFQYAINDMTGTFGAYNIYDERANSLEEKAIRVMNLPYFKQGIGSAMATAISRAYMERILKGFTLISIKLKPNYAVCIRPGDRFRIVTNIQPRIDGYFEVYSSNVDVGGEGVFKLVKIPEPTGKFSRFCESKWCIDTYS